MSVLFERFISRERNEIAAGATPYVQRAPRATRALAHGKCHQCVVRGRVGKSCDGGLSAPLRTAKGIHASSMEAPLCRAYDADHGVLG